MPLPVVLATTYLAINLAFTVWLAREETQGRTPASWVTVLARTLRYGPPLLGALYLVTIAEDWPFVLFVALFFAGAFWLLNGAVNYPTRPPKKR